MRIGIGDGAEIARLEFGEDEAIDLGAGPRGVLDGRGRRFLGRLKGPMFTAFREVDAAARGRGLAVARVGRAHENPLLEVGDDIGGELAAVLGRGHLEIFVGVADGLEEEALLQVAGNDGVAGVAALTRAGAGVEEETALEFLSAGGVAGVAFFHEHGADAFLKKSEFIGGRGTLGISGANAGSRGGADKDAEENEQDCGRGREAFLHEE